MKIKCAIIFLSIILILSCKSKDSTGARVAQNIEDSSHGFHTAMEEPVYGFYTAMQNLYTEYYNNGDIFSDFVPSENLENDFKNIFADQQIYKNIIENLNSRFLQQFDKFLLTLRDVKIKGTNIRCQENDFAVDVSVEASHMFYSLSENDFRYYDNIGITPEDFAVMEEKALSDYEEIGEGKFGGINIKSQETHTFYLKEIDGTWCIKDFVFNIDSYVEL